MSKRKQIDNITTTQANTICVRFMPLYTREVERLAGPMGFDLDKQKRTLARQYCRERGLTPKQLIATPLPK